ncbi:hypothetical protein [Sinorhizobium sp. NFACC03]|uniref:hypothetical protein n=1 Tax=Sinorhizobium sp. NFACC03 TaxID=1566295 RepID=UPI000B80F2B8|nr:hypothetical protein [Sinorhizobium sp. NFACC03]
MTGNLNMQSLLDELTASDAVRVVGTEFRKQETYPDPKPLAIGGPLISRDLEACRRQPRRHPVEVSAS